MGRPIYHAAESLRERARERERDREQDSVRDERCHEGCGAYVRVREEVLRGVRGHARHDDAPAQAAVDGELV